MKEPFYMKTVEYDAVELNTIDTIYSFFQDTDDILGDRYNKEIEMAAVEWMLNNQFDTSKGLLYEVLGLEKTYKFFTAVRAPIIKDNKGPGDIDILAVDPNNPQYSIGFQVKRIKADIDTSNKAIIKAGKIEKGVAQTSFMFSKYRFHKNYLVLLFLADTCNRIDKQPFFRYLTLDEKMPVYRHISFQSLPNEAGIYTYEINQTSKNNISITGMLNAALLKRAITVEQSDATTASIMQFISDPNKF